MNKTTQEMELQMIEKRLQSLIESYTLEIEEETETLNYLDYVNSARSLNGYDS